MISIILPNGSKTYQKQLDDYSNSKINYYFKFKNYPKAGIMQEIQKYFKAKHYHQNKARNNNLSKISFNYTLFKYITRVISADMTIIAVGSRVLSQKNPKNQHQDKHKPSYKQINLLEYIFGAQTYLKEVNTKFIDRFRPVPAVQFEDFCSEAISKEDWIYFQEVLAFQGEFKHLLLLNSFAYG